MSVEENKEIVKKWEDAIFTCDPETIKNAANEAFAPEFFMGFKLRTSQEQGEHWSNLLRDRTPESLSDFQVFHIGEGDYVVSFFQRPFQYKDRTWDFTVTRLILHKIQNGKIVEYRAANNSGDLRKRVDEGEIT